MQYSDSPYFLLKHVRQTKCHCKLFYIKLIFLNYEILKKKFTTKYDNNKDIQEVSFVSLSTNIHTTKHHS